MGIRMWFKFNAYIFKIEFSKDNHIQGHIYTQISTHV